ncbi:uncharacterized protein LOC120111779 [Phoenix dactylifera]|uniref:Uncharacterized protein LOC120111779 n=1 Tax=Phoenix dactylifera TaxID=42345 RepID=A0A8B9AH03_PHODC|nr:uncharacterized protein LOC120111779 [Phoenix dactylifera]
MEGIEKRMRLVERCLRTHGFSLQDPETVGDDKEGEDHRLVLIDKRLSRVEKVLQDKGLLSDDQRSKHATGSTVVREEHTAVGEALDQAAAELEDLQHSAEMVEVIWPTDVQGEKFLRDATVFDEAMDQGEAEEEDMHHSADDLEVE